MARTTDILAPLDGIATHLRAALPSLEHVTILVLNQRDLASDLDEALARHTDAAAILLDYLSMRPVDPSGDGHEFEVTYTATLVSNPILAEDGDTPARERIVDIVATLQGYEPVIEDSGYTRVRVRDVQVDEPPTGQGGPLLHIITFTLQLTLSAADSGGAPLALAGGDGYLILSTGG